MQPRLKQTEATMFAKRFPSQPFTAKHLISWISISAGLSLALLTLGTSANEALINSCNECHGPNGNSTIASVPTIAGVSSFAFEEAFIAYLEDGRVAREYEGENMKSILQKISERDRSELIEHYSQQAFIPAKQPFDSDKAKAGKSIHNNECAKCHSGGGSVAEDDAGILAGQWRDYLMEELKQYQNGNRLGSKKMTKVINKLSESELEALTHYYASQQ
ncbi:MAG: c-type cytochrome [Pseudomonadales bacterium]|nr:c-type cytochrome [Pseudomonadales bacterium]